MPYAKPLSGVCAATALFVCGAAGFPVPPDSLPASEGTLALGSATSATATFAPGAEVHVTGDGFRKDAAVTIAMYSRPSQLGTAVASAAGKVDAAVKLPTNLTGSHTLVALGLGPDGSAHNVQAKITITSDSTAIAGLAYTGLNAAGMAVGGIGLIICGFVLLRTKRYKRPLLPAN